MAVAYVEKVIKENSNSFRSIHASITSRIIESHKPQIDAVLDSVNESTAAIIDNSNKGFSQIKGELVINRSIDKIAQKQTQQSLDEINSNITMSAKKLDRYNKEYRRDMEELRKMLDHMGDKRGDIPNDVTAISGISTSTATASMTMSRYTEDDELSPRMRPTAFVPLSPSKLPALALSSSDSEPSAKNVGATSDQAVVNKLLQENAELTKRLEEEIQKKESVTVEKRQTEKQLNIYTDPRKRKAETVKPVPMKQTASERKAEMQYLERRKSGLMEQMHGRKLLDSERVQSHAPPPAAEPEPPSTSKHNIH